MTQKLQKLKVNMSVILDLTQNQHKQMLLQKDDAKIIELENNIKKLQTFDSGYFRGKNCFEEDSTQNYLVFQPIHKYFKLNANTLYILSWRFKGLSTETIDPPKKKRKI